jgi:hypothetical protein
MNFNATLFAIGVCAGVLSAFAFKALGCEIVQFGYAGMFRPHKSMLIFSVPAAIWLGLLSWITPGGLPIFAGWLIAYVVGVGVFLYRRYGANIN